MKKENSSFNNLIDIYITLEKDKRLAGDAKEMFRWLLCNYFFKEESEAGKNLALFIHDIKLPPFFDNKKTLFDIDVSQLKKFVEGNIINDSLSGTIMLSTQYLKVFYSHHPPAFNKLPEDVRFELMDIIKNRNDGIITAFQKMILDREADKKRKIINLIALILKNIYRKTNKPINTLSKSVEETISSIFHNTDQIFVADQKQLADLKDDIKIKELIKTFFKVKHFNEISEITKLFNEELERYSKRGKI